jgi:hypothetical protein
MWNDKKLDKALNTRKPDRNYKFLRATDNENFKKRFQHRWPVTYWKSKNSAYCKWGVFYAPLEFVKSGDKQQTN